LKLAAAKYQPAGNLTDPIGARQYDPATGRFLSIGPVLETSSPQQLNGYTYAADNPVTSSDPTGPVNVQTGGGGGGSCTGTLPRWRAGPRVVRTPRTVVRGTWLAAPGRPL
jgi:RHS repeat-associated protein